jgi:hypothetical protein
MSAKLKALEKALADIFDNEKQVIADPIPDASKKPETPEEAARKWADRLDCDDWSVSYEDFLAGVRWAEDNLNRK